MASKIPVGMMFTNPIYKGYNFGGNCLNLTDAQKNKAIALMDCSESLTNLAFDLAKLKHNKGEYLLVYKPTGLNDGKLGIDSDFIDELYKSTSTHKNLAARMFTHAYTKEVLYYELGSSGKYRCKLPETTSYKQLASESDLSNYIIESAVAYFENVLLTVLSGYFVPDIIWLHSAKHDEDDSHKLGYCASCKSLDMLYLVHLEIGDKERSEVCENCGCNIYVPRLFQAQEISDLINYNKY